METNEQVGLSLMSEESVRLIGKALDFILVNGEIDVDINSMWNPNYGKIFCQYTFADL